MSVARALRGMLAVMLAVVFVSTLGQSIAGGQPVEPEDRPVEPRPEAESPEELYRRDCVYCHGPDGSGTAQGPSLKEVGTASVDFYLRTGRMPIDNVLDEPRRRQSAYTDAEIRELVDYIGSFISGPPVPEVEPDPQVIARGGELYRLNCAACHQFIGTGGPLIGSDEAPTLHHASPTEVVETIR
ncbi:MAG: c-type cytochrome, partial [Actinomycetota bacterium]|nr:c-type cytochrome [Actinomycetota bacterium]